VSLSAEEVANETLKFILSEFSAFAAQTVPHSMIDLSIHPRSRTIATSQYVGDTCHANEKGQGHVRPISPGEQFFTSAINTPSLPHFVFTPLDLTPSLELSNPSTAATSIVAGEEELHCLDLAAVVLAPAADFFTPPPP